MKDEKEVKKFIDESVIKIAEEIEEKTLIVDQEQVIWLKGQRYALEKFLEWFIS